MVGDAVDLRPDIFVCDSLKMLEIIEHLRNV